MTRLPNPKRFSWLLFAVTGTLTASLVVAGMAFDLGGGSFVKGISETAEYIKFPVYGVMLMLFAIFVGGAACLLGRIFGVLSVGILVVLCSSALLVHSKISSSPHAHLKRVTKAEKIPALNYTEFRLSPSFSDGTSYEWSAICDEEQLQKLSSSLGLIQMSTGSNLRSAFSDIQAEDRFYQAEPHLVASYRQATRTIRIQWNPHQRE